MDSRAKQFYKNVVVPILQTSQSVLVSQHADNDLGMYMSDYALTWLYITIKNMNYRAAKIYGRPCSILPDFSKIEDLSHQDKIIYPSLIFRLFENHPAVKRGVDN